MTRRQFHQLSDAEVGDLADYVVHVLIAELRRLEVAGANDATTWALADALRHDITHHHAVAFRRALVQHLDRRPRA